MMVCCRFLSNENQNMNLVKHSDDDYQYYSQDETTSKHWILI